MVQSERVIRTYEALSGITGRMLEAATRGQWEELVLLEQQCRSLIEELKAGGETPLPPEQQRRKAELLRKVLADDARIRDLTLNWMGQLERFLGNTRRQRQVRQAYRQV